MTSTPPQLYEFGPFRVDPVRRLLLRDGESVSLTPKAFDTLLALIENSDRVVDKDELLRTVWPDAVVEERNLTVNISTLRKALGEAAAEHRYIVTVPGRGYRFAASVRRVDGTDLIVERHTLSRVVIEETDATSDEPDRQLRADNGVTLGTAPVIKRVGILQRHKKDAVIITTGALMVIVALVLYILSSLKSRSGPVEPFQKMRMTTLTNSNNVTLAAVSLDGRYVSYVVGEAGRQSLWLRQVATTAGVQIVPPAEAHYEALTFSADSAYIYFIKGERGGDTFGLYQISILGGPSVKLSAGSGAGVCFSTHSRRIAFVRYDASRGESALMVANLDGTGEKTLTTRKHPDVFYRTAWSPDEKTIACSVNTLKGDEGNVVEVRVEDGSERQLTSDGWGRIRNVAWLPDGSGLLITADDAKSGVVQIWRLSYPGGEPRRITNDTNNYTGLSLTADSSTLATIKIGLVSSIWIVPGADAHAEKQITFGLGQYDGLRGISFAPDGRLVYASYTGYSLMDVWIMKADGSGQNQLTVDAGANGYPSVSPDGRYIVFGSSRTGTYHIWRMDIDGGNPKKLSNGEGEYFAHCSPDSKWVIYSSLSSGKETLWKVPIDGGEAVQLTVKFSSQPVISPDGKLIACFYNDEQSGPGRKVAIMQFDGGKLVRTLDIPFPYSPAIEIKQIICWTPDGRALTYVDTQNGISNIWLQPIDGGPPKQLTEFKYGRVLYYDWTADGAQLAFARGSLINDAVLITDFK